MYAYKRWVGPEPEIRARAYNKNQILSPKVGLGPKPDFFIYIVKPEPELSPTYLVTFSSPSPNHAAQPGPKKFRPDPSLMLT